MHCCKTGSKGKASNRTIVILGNATDPRVHGGIPHAFLNAAKRRDFAEHGVDLDLRGMEWPRRIWNLKRLCRGLKCGGFQYSAPFLDEVEKGLSQRVLSGEILSFSQHFPRAETVRRAGGRISYYLDATLTQLTSGRGLDVRIGDDVRGEALAIERRNYELADRLVFWSSWAATAAVDECGADKRKVSVIMPGANLTVPPARDLRPVHGRPGKDRDFVLGFVGKDWRRKGLPLICDVRNILARRGWRVIVRCAGMAPRALQERTGVEFVGYINKADDPTAFPNFLASCDLGCLFSDREALGLSTLEFLRAGVPVAGFAIEGPAETIPPDAGLRFNPIDSADQIANRIESYLASPSEQLAFRELAQKWGQFMTWDRCLQDFEELWQTGKIAHPVRPALGWSSEIDRSLPVML
jgi:glycosyltransferase involved in cell wall biosynthesis